MAIAGEAAVRIVPSLKGFHNEVKRKLEAKRVDFDVNVSADTRPFHSQMTAARRLQESMPVTIPVRTDWAGLKRDLSQVEHIFQRNNLVKGIRFNIKVIGLDALPAIAYAAGGAASGLDALAKSALVLPAALSAAGAAVGAMSIGLSGVGDAFKAYGKSAKDSSQNLREMRDAQRDLQSAQRDLSGAIRDQRRELEDLNAELRRSTLDEADALLNLQESADRLKQGGFKSITEYQRAQLRFLRDVEGLKDVRKQNIRLLEDTSAANQKGILESDRVSSAIDRVTSAVDRLNQSQQKNDGLDDALSKLSPNARKFVETAKGMEAAWNDLKFTVQDNLFAGLDQSLKQLADSALPGLKVGLAQVATGLNSNVKAAVDAVGNGTNAGLWERIFGNTQGGLENFKNSLDPILTGFSRMAEVGSTFLPRIGQAFVTVGERFDAWTQKISQDGSLAHWIDQGLDAVTNLGNLAINVGSIISSVGEAFDAVSGTEGGFIGYFARETKELADSLKGEGRAGLVRYFTLARDLIEKVKSAFGDMRPLISSIVDAARAFTGVLLPVAGALAKLAQWIEKNTGLVTNLFLAYATWRTVAPMIDFVTNSWKNYQKVTGALANFAPTSTHFQKVNHGLTVAASNFKSFGGVMGGASSQIKTFTGTLDPAHKKVAALFSPANNLTSAFGQLANKADYAKMKVGTSGVGATLRGALGGLVSFIGPALGAGAFGIAMSAAISALMSLSDAHDDAREAADRQAEGIRGIVGALDEMTGAVTAQSLKRTDDQFKAFPMGPAAGGNRNIYQDAQKAGLGTPEQLLAATIPANQALADSIEQKTIQQGAAKVAKSSAWRDYEEKWKAAGITPEILFRAQIGQPDALDKVRNLERQTFGGKTRDEFGFLDRVQFDNMFPGSTLPSVADSIVSAGTFEEAAVGSALRAGRNANVSGGNDIKDANQRLGGKPTLTPEGAAFFSRFGGNIELSADATRSIGTVLVNSDPGEIDPAIGTVRQLNPNQWAIELSGDASKSLMTIPKPPGFARGGMIGGIGTGTSDSNLLMASRGEFVTRKDAVDYYGPEFFQRLNNMELPAFAPGGPIPPPVVPWQEQARQALTGAGITNNAPVVPPTPPAGVGPLPPVPMPQATVLPAPTIPTRPSPAAAPAPAPTPAATGLPKPAGPAAPATGSYGYGLLNLAQKTGIAPSVLSRMVGMGGLSQPYAGLPVGTNIQYGQAGFPDWVGRLAARFGVQASTYPGHQERGGTNKGIDFSGPVENMRALAQYLTSANIPGLEQVIFQDPRDGAMFGVDPGDRGPNQTIADYYANDWAGHQDHIHTRMSASIPTPEELMALMQQGGMPAGIGIGAVTGALMPGLMGATGMAGWPSSLDNSQVTGDKKKSGLENLIDYWTNTRWLEPENIENFLTGQARTVGSSLLNIGMGFLQGITGLDFSGLVGTGQEIGNFVLGTANSDMSGGGAGGTDATALNEMTQEEIDRYLNGELPLGVTGGLDSVLGADISSVLGMSGLLDETGVSMSFNPGGGAEQWRPVVRRVLETYGPQYGLTNLQAWEDAIVRQIQSESNGDPTADNPNDNNGMGGKQHVSGLLQFLPETFAANNITGGDYLDPVAQIAAVIPYVVNKYGMDANGAPNQIGRGVGYARGGKIRGIGGKRSDANLVRVSRGEFLHNANAVDHYGVDFLSRLNNRQIPKEALPGFNTGMWWNPFAAGPAPAPTPPPAPAPAPAAAPAPAPPPQPLAPPVGGEQSAGPLPIAQPLGMSAPSTGGAPGPGATAPAPDPGALPAVADALSGLGGIGMGGGGLPQPGATGGAESDPRGALGAAPTTQNHNSPVLSGAIQGAASSVGSIISLAAQAAAMGGTMGASAAVPGVGSAASAGIQAGAQMAGQIATGAVNILSSLLVGTATNGSTGSASGVPLLPQRQPMQTGVPDIGGQYQDNRTYNLTNMDEYRRLQEREAAQQSMPFIGKF